jgi:hypothetical protein
MSSSGIAVGTAKGFPVEKRETKARPSHAKGRLSKRTKMVRELVSEVSRPYK